MHREISAGKVGMSDASFPCESPFLLKEQEEMHYSKAATEQSPAVLCTEDFALRSTLENMEEAPKEMFKSTALSSPSSQARKHVKQC